MNEELNDTSKEFHPLNGFPEDRIPLKENERHFASSGYTTTIAFDWVDVNEDDFKKPTLWQRFLNLFKRNE